MLYEYLKKRMLRHPGQIISDGQKNITYKQMLKQAEKMGETLHSNKYALVFDSDLDTARALLACLYANKTAIVLCKKYGEIHIKNIIDAMNVSLVITEKGIEQISQIQDEQENLSDVALIMCTSGTTGRPKGAMITYENLFTNLMDISEYFKVSPDDRILIARPLYHCAVLTGEFLLSLIKGLKITFLSEGFVPTKILETARKNDVTVLCGTPTLLYHLSMLNLRASSPLTLKTIAVSGECMTEIVAKTMRKAFVNTDIYSVYGLTEASPRVSCLPPWEFDAHPLSTGYPLSSLKAKIVDDELLISGKSIMKGYYNDSEATKRVKKDGWLYTGDIAEIDDKGRIYIKCRRDNMIIRAGMNIYPQEIENALKSDADIDDVLAYGKRKESFGEEIHIKVVTKLTKAQIYSVCKRVLPSFQLPDAIEVVEQIPKNISGKVIRNAENN